MSSKKVINYIAVEVVFKDHVLEVPEHEMKIAILQKLHEVYKGLIEDTNISVISLKVDAELRKEFSLFLPNTDQASDKLLKEALEKKSK